MRRRCRFEYGTSSFTPHYPAQAWIPSDSTVGGSRTSAAGTPASYVARRDALIEITLRVLESEWPDFVNLLIWGQSAQPLTWYPDVLEPTSFAVYLNAPLAGEQVVPTRDGDYPRMFLVPITLRGAGTVVPWLPFFGEA